MNEITSLLQKMSDEIVKLRKDLSELKEDHEFLKQVVRNNYKEDPGTIYLDEYMKMRKNVNDIKSGN